MTDTNGAIVDSGDILAAAVGSEQAPTDIAVPVEPRRDEGAFVNAESPESLELDPSRPVSTWALSRRKRTIDILASAAGLVMLAPVLAATAVLVWREFGRPVVFLQERPGLNGSVFTIRKFRSMTNDTDALGRLLPPEQRLTRFGRLLRATSLDELPELMNVLAGEMSLVGPRPLRVEYTARYNPEQARRLLVRPGITGPAQVRGRNLLRWEDRFIQDVDYVDGATLATDARVLVATLHGVVRRHGVEPPGSLAMTPFAGIRLES